ncbi:MAG: hypothetical protein ACR2NZ_18355 [Rubripirellula sp.]
MRTCKLIFLLPVGILATAVSGQMPAPVLAVPGEVVLKEDFVKPNPLPKSIWQKRQGTRWEVADGVLRGQQSSPEFQAAREDHFGYEPRLSLPITPPEFIATFRLRFIDGSETSIVPFIEFGHHVCRVRFSEQGTSLLADHEIWKLAEAPDFVWESGKWYEITAEMKDSQFVMQIKDGPTLFAEHESFANSPSSGGNGLGVAGPRKGFVELDDLTIWSVQSANQPGWGKRKSQIAEFTPVQVKQPKVKKTEPKPKRQSRDR